VGQPELPAGSLVGSLDDRPPELDEDALLEQITLSSPAVLAAIAARDRAEAALQRATVEPLSDVTVQGVVQGDNGTGSANANLQISFPVPIINRNQGAIRQAQAEVLAASETIRRVQLEIAGRMATVLQRYRRAAGQVRDYAVEGGILATANESLELITRAYSAGEVGYLELLTAQRVLADARLLQVEALAEYWASRIELEGYLLKGANGG
jgi:cobalt-zinc-cadmium efflux system outer membrane protein